MRFWISTKKQAQAVLRYLRRGKKKTLVIPETVYEINGQTIHMPDLKAAYVKPEPTEENE